MSEVTQPEAVAAVGAGAEKPTKPNQTTQLLAVAQAGSLFHSQDKESFITVPVGKHQETYPVNSEETRRWLRNAFFKAHRKAVTASVLDTALKTLEAEAVYERSMIPVHIRVAEHEGAIYLDLANEEWQAVKIAPQGAQVVNRYPVRFRRPPAMEKLPYPAATGDLRDLRPFINMTGEDNWTNLIAWLIGALRPRGPYPVLEVNGPQGSAKSTACRVIRSLIDPNKSPLRNKPKNDQDLFITATKGWVCAFDNLSGIPEGLSDDLCRIATGGGFSTRTLYTNTGETVIDAMRPILVNGIGDQATRPDLLDRTITISIQAISDEQRRDEESFWRDFQKAAPSILGGLLAAVAGALGNIGNIKLSRLPRMADYAKWVTAAEPALGWKPGTFMKAYARNKDGHHGRVLEAEPIAQMIVDLVNGNKGRWEGTATALLEDLTEASQYRRVKLPENASALSGKLTRIEPTLLRFGITTTRDTTGHAGVKVIALEQKTPASADSRASEAGNDAA